MWGEGGIYVASYLPRFGSPRLTDLLSDLGRATADASVVRVEHTTEGAVVTLDSGAVLSLGEGETVAFPQPMPTTNA